MKKRVTVHEMSHGMDVQWLWPEFMFFILFAVGFVVAIIAPTATLAYIFIGISGIMTGRFLYEKKGRDQQFPVYMIVYGFLFGFVLALIITKRADWKIALVVFIISNMISYYIHEKGFYTD